MSCCMDRSMERASESCCMWTAPSAANRVLSCLSDLIVRRFSGQCLVGNTIIPGGEWLNWKSLEQLRWRRAGSSKNNQNAVAGTIEWSKRVVLTLGESFFVRCSGAKAARSRSVTVVPFA